MSLPFFARQIIRCEVGNTINMSSTIRALYDHYGQKIPVVFDTPVVREMYENSPYIEIISIAESKGKRCVLNSQCHNLKIPDYEFIYKKTMKDLGLNAGKIPHTFVDHHEPPAEYMDKKYVVVARGCLGTALLAKKDPGDTIYKYIIEKISNRYEIVFVGGEKEREQIRHMAEWVFPQVSYNEVGDIKRTIGLVRGAQFSVTNDTGICHMIGSMDKSQFILWKRTPFKRSKNMGTRSFYSHEGQWQKDFDKWYEDFIRSSI